MRWTLPNILTLARICLTPVIALLPFIQGYWPKVIAFVIFLAAGASDVGRLPRRPPQRSERAGAAARPDRRQAAAVRDAHPHLLAHAPSDDPGGLPHSLVGQLPGVGGAAARGARAPDDGVPVLRQAARRRDPGDGGGEAQSGRAERLHRGDAVLVRVEGRPRRPPLGRMVPELLERVPRR